ncbi:MAG: hypothetical protein ACK5UI_09875 [Bacteroidota bacterium]
MTAQASDSITYNNKSSGMDTEPLRDYIKELNLPYHFVSPSTFCNRGYFADWAVDSNKLFLVGFEGWILDYLKVGMDYIFPGEDVVFAHWYTGTIRASRGEMVAYIHGGYDSTYEGYVELKFESGILISATEKWLTPEEIEAAQRDADESMRDF